MVTVSAALTYAFQMMFNVSIPPLTGVGEARTVSPAVAPVMVIVSNVRQTAPRIAPELMDFVPDRCFKIVVPEPIFSVLTAAVPLTVVVTPDLPIVREDALVVPKVILAALPVSSVSVLAPLD